MAAAAASFQNPKSVSEERMDSLWLRPPSLPLSERDSKKPKLSPSPSPPSRVCMICGLSPSEKHVYIVDIINDESSLGDTHTNPHRSAPVFPDVNVDAADLSAFVEMTPNIVLVDFPLIQVCALGSVLYFFPEYPSTEVLSYELPTIGMPMPLNDRVVYGEYGGMLKKAPLNLQVKKVCPVAIRYGTCFLVFSTRIPTGICSKRYGAGDQFEIYHPYSESSLKKLPNLTILDGKYGGGTELYNIRTKSSEPFISSAEKYADLSIKSYSLINDHTFVVGTNFGVMFCLDLENPWDNGWELYLGGRIDMNSPGVHQTYVAENGVRLEGTHVYEDKQGEFYGNVGILPRSPMPIRVHMHVRIHTCMTLLDSFKHPHCTPCIVQTGSDSVSGCSFLVMDVVRLDLSKFPTNDELDKGLENEEWAEIINSFKFCVKQKSSMFGCLTMFPI